MSVTLLGHPAETRAVRSRSADREVPVLNANCPACPPSCLRKVPSPSVAALGPPPYPVLSLLGLPAPAVHPIAWPFSGPQSVYQEPLFLVRNPGATEVSPSSTMSPHESGLRQIRHSQRCCCREENEDGTTLKTC